MHACVAMLAALAGEMADISDTCLHGEDLMTNPAVCHDKIVNQWFDACSGLPPQCSTFSSVQIEELKTDSFALIYS